MNIRFLFVIIIVLLTFLNNAKAQDGETGDKKDMSFHAQQINLAYQLIRYGYQEKAAFPLITALQILRSQGTSSYATMVTKVEGSEPMDNRVQKGNKVSFEENQIVEDAKKFASGNTNLLNLLKELQSQTRGALPGKDAPIRITDCVNARATDVWKATFRGGEKVFVIILGDGDTDLDVYVYDSNGNIVADDKGCDDSGITFTPYRTGTFLIKILNLGNVYNCYLMTIYQ